MSKQFILATTTLALLSGRLVSAEMLLDDVMSPKIQEATGVEDLTPKQKRALENWINDTFVLKKHEENQGKDTSNLSLSINVNNGEQLRLSDGTLWDIDPADVAITATWITPFPIKVGSSGNPSYPTLLTNVNDNVSVRARSTNTLNPAPTAPAQPQAPAQPMPTTPAQPAAPSQMTPAKPTKPQPGAPAPAKPQLTTRGQPQLQGN